MVTDVYFIIFPILKYTTLKFAVLFIKMQLSSFSLVQIYRRARIRSWPLSEDGTSTEVNRGGNSPVHNYTHEKALKGLFTAPIVERQKLL